MRCWTGMTDRPGEKEERNERLGSTEGHWDDDHSINDH